MNLEEFQKKHHYSLATPMLQQYLDIKYNHQDCVLLFRMGDFYECFFDDAINMSKVLGIALAKRGKHANQDLAMCGIPYHALNTYLPRVIEDGYKVAICEQLESPEEAKKNGGYKAIVKREVVKIITAGTNTEEGLIPDNLPNYLSSIIIDKHITSIGYADLSTSEFSVIDLDTVNLASELERINPKEILISEAVQSSKEIMRLLEPYKSRIVYQINSYFEVKKSQRVILDYYKIVNITSLGDLHNNQLLAVGAVLEYVNITQKRNKPKLPFPKIINHKNMMLIDASTRKNLEIVTTTNNSYKGSLLSVINYTVTKGGSRLLHKFLSAPLCCVDAINSRLELTDFFYSRQDLIKNLRSSLNSTADLERSLSRLLMNRANPKDLLAISNSLECALEVKSYIEKNLKPFTPDSIKMMLQILSGDQEISQVLQTALMDDLPNTTSDGDFIKSDYHPKLLELRNLLHNSSAILETLKQKYRKITGVENLKIAQNNILGLFIEVSSKNSCKINDDKFIHRQTTSNAVRFTTDELKELEAKLLNAKVLSIALEQEIFDQLCELVIKNYKILSDLAKILSKIDVFCNFAYIAKELGYCKPEVRNDLSFKIIDGKHPVVENSLSKQHKQFVSNNCDLSSAQRLWLMTGPNMAGKSTFLRQNAIIAILAQIGSYVPAKSAQLGVVDKLFSRIGASDDLAKGQSTFMIEMAETSAILAQATSKSLVILDEVGRGTSTHDGISIAWSCIEYIHNVIACRCIFATHYHELTTLTQKLNALKTYTIKIHDKNDDLIFLHKIEEGIAKKSYGLHVAELAGLPPSVLTRAKEILFSLEAKNCEVVSDYSKSEVNLPQSHHLHHNVIEIIKNLDPNQLSPKQALDTIYKLKQCM